MKFASSTNVDVKKNISIFILLSFVIFFLDRGDNKYLKNIRYAINDTIIYSSVILKSPFNFILETSRSVTNFFQKDNQINESKLISLENKVERLKNQNISISLQLKNLKKISGEELYKYETIQVKVLLYKSNILHETIIINKGKNDGIKVGDPLIKNNILVGKILKTNFNTSHGILITNLNSRIPVRIGKNNYKAIVVGNPKSEKQLNLEFLPKEFTFEDGDYIYTTSINNIMPEGILVGQIKLRNDDDFVAEPLYDFSQLDYLTVVNLNFGKGIYLFLISIINDSLNGLFFGTSAILYFIVFAVAAFQSSIKLRSIFLSEWISFGVSLILAYSVFFGLIKLSGEDIILSSISVNFIITLIGYPVFWFSIVNILKNVNR